MVENSGCMYAYGERSYDFSSQNVHSPFEMRLWCFLKSDMLRCHVRFQQEKQEV